MKFFFGSVIMDYGEIIRRAWNITKKYKYLLVFGFILALFGGRGGYSSSNSICLDINIFTANKTKTT